MIYPSVSWPHEPHGLSWCWDGDPPPQPGLYSKCQLSLALLVMTENAPRFKNAFSFAEYLVFLQELFLFHQLGSNHMRTKVMWCISFKCTCLADNRGSGNICWECRPSPWDPRIDHGSHSPVTPLQTLTATTSSLSYCCYFWNLHLNSSWPCCLSHLSVLWRNILIYFFHPDINYAEDRNGITCFSWIL